VTSWYGKRLNEAKIPQNYGELPCPMVRCRFHAVTSVDKVGDIDRVNWVRSLPFIILHLGLSWGFYSGLELARRSHGGRTLLSCACFAITGIYHRYFSHRTFKTSRPGAIYLCNLRRLGDPARTALVGGQPSRAPSQLRYPADPHSPVHYSFFRSHAGWFMCNRFYATQYHRIRDFARFPNSFG
jgi:stearoyl-CoA desaturase (delta-9 desaturase)